MGGKLSRSEAVGGAQVCYHTGGLALPRPLSRGIPQAQQVLLPRFGVYSLYPAWLGSGGCGEATWFSVQGLGGQPLASVAIPDH